MEQEQNFQPDYQKLLDSINRASQQKFLYLITLSGVTHTDEHFVKIGITSKDLEERFKNKLHYVITSTRVIEFEDGHDAINFESIISKNFLPRNNKFKIKGHLYGYDECYKLDTYQPLMQVFDLIEGIKSGQPLEIQQQAKSKFLQLIAKTTSDRLAELFAIQNELRNNNTN